MIGAVISARALTRVAVALGSNLGDRAAHLDFAVSQLSRLLTSLRVSRWYETEAVGATLPGTGAVQPRFLNGAVVGETTRSARELLDALLTLECARGRERPFPGAPRTLDLDLVLFGDQVLHEPGLIVPHPRFRERRFVLEPLVEIAPDLIDPITGHTARELLTRFADAASGAAPAPD